MNLPAAPAIPQTSINVGLSKFKPAINNEAAAIESPRTRKRFGVGSKYRFNLGLLLVCMICVYSRVWYDGRASVLVSA
jgi:hypothetical protein